MKRYAGVRTRVLLLDDHVACFYPYIILKPYPKSSQVTLHLFSLRAAIIFELPIWRMHRGLSPSGGSQHVVVVVALRHPKDLRRLSLRVGARCVSPSPSALGSCSEPVLARGYWCGSIDPRYGGAALAMDKLAPVDLTPAESRHPWLGSSNQHVKVRLAP